MARPMQDCIVLLGDSLTQRMDTPGNLHQRVAEAYQRKLDIVNRGFGGFNTAWFVPLLDQIFAKKEDAEKSPFIRLVTVWFGTNDSTLPSRDQFLSLQTFRTNINHMLSCLTSPSSPYAVADTPVSIVLITPGPCLHSQMEADKRPHRSLDRTREFKDEVLRIGAEWKQKERTTETKWSWQIETLDFWEALVQTGGGEGVELDPYFFDGVHLTTAGYTVLWDHLSRLVKVKFKDRGLDWEDFEDLPRRVPPFTDIDLNRPESVLDLMALPRIRGGVGPVLRTKTNAFER